MSQQDPGKIFPELPFVHETAVHMLADAAARAGDAIAIVDEDRTLTYQQYLRCVGGFASELAARGVRGGRVALVCGNSLEMAVTMFAVHAAGAQAVPVNPIYTARELVHIFKDADLAAVVYDSAVASVVEPLIRDTGVSCGVSLGVYGGRRLDVWKDDPATGLPLPLPTAADPATLQYTGGTTGLPKGVNITHGQMSVNVSQREAVLPTIADDETILCVMPLFHVFAVSMCLHLAAYARGKLVILRRYKPELVFQAIEREKITRLPAGPTIFIGLMSAETFSGVDLSTLRTAYSGSAPLPEETLRRWQARTGCPILEGYGQSEAGPILTYIGEHGEPVPGSVGPPVPLTEVQIVDVETGTKVLSAGEIGEIRARGPQIMSGYRNRPAETAEALRNGWLYTGDIGEFDKSGYLYIRDRKKDMVITGGYNVYPREIDDVLHSHPDVLDAASVGVPDEYRGEVVKALVMLKDGSTTTVDDLFRHCGKNLAKYKVPASIEITSQIPRTSVGKTDRKVLRELINKTKQGECS